MVKGDIVLNDRYIVLSKLGAGGMADVYKGRDSMLNRLVAIKVLKKEYRENADFVKKFISEAQAAAGLMNPNIVNVYDVGEDRGLYYMVMELVEGITLKEYIQKKGKLSTREVLSIAIQMCTGVEAAHKHNIIHRDIKPQNIMISTEGKVKVTDFGIARAVDSNTVSTSAMGSVHYVSPEQARGGYCDVKSDIYSVGITMYEMVTGRVPFDGDSTVGVAMKHLQENIVPPSEYAPDISKALERIILKCTQKSPERRYASTSLLIQDLKRALVDPSGSFVEVTPIRNMGDTVMISSDEIGRASRGQSKYNQYDDDYEDSDDDYDDDDYEDDDEYDDENSRRKTVPTASNGRHRGKADEVNPQMNKMMKILTGVAAAIVILIIALVIGNAAGVFKFGKTNVVEKNEEVADIQVPNLLGQTEAVGKEMCEKKHLVMVVVSQKQSDQYKEGQIMEQSIKAGELVTKKTEIEVVICSGAEEVTIPDVSGSTEDEATKVLKDMGFKSANIEVQLEYSNEYENGEVVGTNPPVGETVTVDSKITIIVSKGAEKVEVPKLEGMTISEAQKALADKGLQDGSYTEEYNNTVEAGKVISQSLKAGKKVDAGTSVSYVVSKGKEPAKTVTVPTNLTGKSLADAIKALSNKGLYYKEVQSDSPSPSGIVVEVDPGEGTSVEVGSTITLYVSNGSGATPSNPDDTTNE